MKTFTQLAVLALALVGSADLAIAQQSVRRPAPKTVSTAKKPVAKPTTSQVRKPVVASTAPQTQAPAQATSNQEPAETRQAPAQQTVARPAAAHTSSRSSNRSRAVYLNAGLGLATYYGGGLPLGISVEVAAKNNFSVGGSIDYYRYNYGYYSSGYNFVYAGARGSYHLGEALNVQNNSFDPYIGASLGFRYAGGGGSYSYYDYGSGYNSGLFVGLHVGARFMFAPKVGAFAEVGYGVSAVKLGLAAKF